MNKDIIEFYEKEKIKDLTISEIQLINEMKENCLKFGYYTDPKAKDKYKVLIHLTDLGNLSNNLIIENQRLETIIDKAIDYINNLKYWYEYSSDTICSLDDKFISELLDILNNNRK